MQIDSSIGIGLFWQGCLKDSVFSKIENLSASDFQGKDIEAWADDLLLPLKTQDLANQFPIFNFDQMLVAIPVQGDPKVLLNDHLLPEQNTTDWFDAEIDPSKSTLRTPTLAPDGKYLFIPIPTGQASREKQTLENAEEQGRLEERGVYDQARAEVIEALEARRASFKA